MSDSKKDSKKCKVKVTPDSVIISGYMLEEFERWTTVHAWETLHCIDTSIVDLKADGATVNQYDATEERAALMLLMSQNQASRKVHKSLSEKLLALGYPPVTDEQIKKIVKKYNLPGAGGNR